MKVKSFWLTVSVFIIVLGSCVKSEAYEITARNGISFVKSGGKTQTGNGGNTSSRGRTSRNGAAGRIRPRIPKPAEDKRGKGKRKKKQLKDIKVRGKKTVTAKSRKSKKRSLSVTGGERNDLKSRQFQGNKKFAENPLKGQKRSEEPDIRTERADDIPLLLGIMKQMGMDRVLDNHIPVHWKQRRLSWGRTCIIRLAYILSEGDHRKVSMRDYIKGMRIILSNILGQEIEEPDFTDDRLGILLKNLSKREFWEKIEKELSERTIEAYELPKKIVRCDATTISGYHKIEDGGLFQKGVSKDDPHRPQIKLMSGALDPLGMPLASDTVSGEKADDGLYRPLIMRMNEYPGNDDVIYVGDCKLSAFATRQNIKGIEKHYLCPLPMTGHTAKQMGEWIKIGVMKEKQGMLSKVYTQKNDKEVQIAKGYELERSHTGEYDDKIIRWKERLVIVCSASYANAWNRGLEKRLADAMEKLYALTPPRGPGKRQITEESALKAAIAKIQKHYKVEGLLNCKYVKETERLEKYIGKGRGSANRPKKITERIRYQIAEVKRRGYRVRREKERHGWKVFVTDVSPKRLSFGDVVKCYRKEYRVEKIFNRLKSRLNVAPYYVKREDQVVGMNNLLTLGVRVLTLAEYTVRRSLRKDRAELKGLHPGNPKKRTDTPTSERLLEAFSKITLTIIKSGNSVKRHLTPITDLQKEIVRRLGLNCSIYKNLEFEKSPAKLSEW